MDTVIIVLIGITGGFASGLLGIGGAVIMVPALVYIAGFNMHTAQGTTLCAMVPPIGALAAIQYYRSGFADIKTAVIIATVFILGAFLGSKLAVKMQPHMLKRIFGLVLLYISLKMIIGK